MILILDGGWMNSILEQMRLESQRGAWPRVRVGGRKINRGFLKEEKNTVRSRPNEYTFNNPNDYFPNRISNSDTTSS